MLIKKVQRKIRRHKKVRAKLIGTSKIPRLAVFRSNKHMYVQLIDDTKGETIISASDIDINTKISGNKKQIAKEIGKVIAQKAKAKKISSAIFDRGGFLYIGRVRECAEGAREGGLKF